MDEWIGNPEVARNLDNQPQTQQPVREVQKPKVKVSDSDAITEEAMHLDL
jgi:hypothetical protein